MGQDKRIPAGYFEGNKKKPFYIKFVAKDIKTGEEKAIHPSELTYEKRLEITDRFAEGLGYKRVSNEVGA